MHGPRFRLRLARTPDGRRHPWQSAQALVEFSLVLPLFLMLCFAIVDSARYALAHAELEVDALSGVRATTLPGSVQTDCSALSAATGGANSPVSLVVDPTSIFGDGPISGTTPSNNQGDAYIYPAVAQSGVTTTTKCGSSGGSRASGPVTVTITYQFVPTTPIISTLWKNGITITVSATQQTQY
jgi:Flp pilus assembly protein TadG